MMRIRRTPRTEDTDRLADRVWREGMGRIEDYDSFLSVWNRYMEGEDLNDKQSTDLRETVYDILVDKRGMPDRPRDADTRAPSRPKYAGQGPRLVGFVQGKPVGVRSDKIVYEAKGDVRERIVYRDTKGRFARYEGHGDEDR